MAASALGALGIVLSLIALSAGVRRRDVVTDSSGDQTVRDTFTTQV